MVWPVFPFQPGVFIVSSSLGQNEPGKLSSASSIEVDRLMFFPPFWPTKMIWFEIQGRSVRNLNWHFILLKPDIEAKF